MNDDKYTDDFGYDEPKDKYKDKTSQFIVEGDKFFPCTQTVKVLPSGYYRIRNDYSRGLFFKKLLVTLNKLVTLENSAVHRQILDDVSHFWESREEYQKRGRIYRRNILLHSAPGMGKTSLLNIIVDDLINKRNGFVLSISDQSDILNFKEAMTYVKSAMPNQPVIAIIEDIDNFVDSNQEIETELLNILDGISTFDNLITIATTNYPEKLRERYINRPSRFNRVIEFPYPNEALRREFLTKINLKEDIESINLDEWVDRTEGYTIDFLKELSDSVFIGGNSEEDTFELLDNMLNTKVVKNEQPNNNKMGFKKSSITRLLKDADERPIPYSKIDNIEGK